MGIKCPQCKTENTSDSEFCKKCATPLPSPKESPVTITLETPKEELTTGSTFAGRYQIIEELGKGGMGKVYKAQDTEINEKVAIKLLKPEVAADEKTIERFRNELKFARKIRHKNVCQMFDLGEEKGTRYITMEFVDGEDLKRLIRKIGQMPIGRTVSIAMQVCDGLAEAHRLGVIHRDLKPQNIMVDEEGNARIMDFGIARSIKAKGITDAGMMIGTPDYMSPEQVEGKDVDPRSDIYSLGVILYEMVTGKVPFEGDTPFTVGVKHKSEMPRNPRELNSQIPAEFSLVIMRCLEKDRKERYQSAGELRSELMKIAEGIPSTEREVPKRKPLTSREIKVQFTVKKLFIPALVILGMAIIAVVILKLLSPKEAPVIPSDKLSLAVVYFKNNTGDSNLDHWRNALAEWLITDLGQSRYIKVLDGDRLYGILRKLDLLEAESYASEDLTAVAKEARVNYVLKGSLSKAGDVFRIDFALQDMSTGESVGSDFVKGAGEASFHTMVDDLTTRIKAHLKLSAEQIASDIDEEVGKISTSSPEAYRYYVEGRKYHHQVDFEKSLEFMEKAIAIDPNFAMAYRSRWASSGKKEYLQKAFELSGQLSAKERFWIEGDYYRQSERTYDKSIEAFMNLLELNPESRPGNACLAIVYNDLEEWDKAIKQCEISIQYGEETYYAYDYQAWAYMAKGLYDKAKYILEYYLNNFSYHRDIQHRLILNYLCQGKYDLSHLEVDKALSRSRWENFIREKGVIYHCQGNLDEAEKEYQKLFEFDDPEAHDSAKKRLAALRLLQGRFSEAKDLLYEDVELARNAAEAKWEEFAHRYLAYIHLVSGNPEEALRECEKAWDLADMLDDLYGQRRILCFKGLGYIGLGKLEKAQEVANQLKEMIQEGMHKKDMRLYYLLMGNIENKKENSSKAIEYFEEALALLPFQHDQYDAQALFFDPLALAYTREGDLDKAMAEYERIISLSVGRLFWGDKYARSFYMLGKIYEQKGWKGKAIENYEKFLDIWKDADPGIPEIEDAQNMLEVLKRN